MDSSDDRVPVLSRVGSEGIETRSARIGRSLSRVSFSEEVGSVPATTDDQKSCGKWWNQPSTLIYAPVPVLFMVQSMLIQALLPGIQAEWFTKCDDKLMGKCKPDYQSAQAVRGLVDSLRNLCAFFSAALIGRLSDVYGRKSMLVFGIIVSALPTVALFVTNSSSAEAFFGVCILSGLLGVGSMPSFLFSIGNAYVADAYDLKDRPAQFGYLAAISTGSMIFNPLIGGLTRKMDLEHVYLVCLSIVGVLILYLCLIVPESLSKEKRNEFTCSRTLNPLAPLRLLSQSRIMRWISFVYFLGSAAEVGVGEIALMYTDDVLDLEKQDARDFNEILYAVLGVAMMFGNSIGLKLLLKLNLKPTALFTLSEINNAIHILVYIVLEFVRQRWVVFANALPCAFIGIAGTASASLITTHMGAQEQGFAFGTQSAVSGIAGILSPLVYSELYSYFGKRYNLPMVPFSFGVFLAASSAIVAWFGPLRSMEVKKKRMLAPSHSILFRDTESDSDDDDDQMESSLLDASYISVRTDDYPGTPATPARRA